MSDLYLPDTPEGRAIEQVACALSDRAEPGQLATAKKLTRIGALALQRLVGADAACRFLIGLSQDALRTRGCGEGAKRAAG